jgi:PleD family two-component response regulator
VESEDFEEAIKIADRRLYTAKNLGKHRIVNDIIEKELKEED